MADPLSFDDLISRLADDDEGSEGRPALDENQRRQLDEMRAVLVLAGAACAALEAPEPIDPEVHQRIVARAASAYRQEFPNVAAVQRTLGRDYGIETVPKSRWMKAVPLMTSAVAGALAASLLFVIGPQLPGDAGLTHRGKGGQLLAGSALASGAAGEQPSAALEIARAEVTQPALLLTADRDAWALAFGVNTDERVREVSSAWRSLAGMTPYGEAVSLPPPGVRIDRFATVFVDRSIGEDARAKVRDETLAALEQKFNELLRAAENDDMAALLQAELRARLPEVEVQVSVAHWRVSD